VLVDSGTCETPVTSEDECRRAQAAFGSSTYYTFNMGMYPSGCLNMGWQGSVTALNIYSGSTVQCGSTVANMNVKCICKNAGGGAGSGDGNGDSGKVCIDVRKKKACKALPQCNFDKGSSPMCTDKNSGDKIPMKDFCEVISTRGWCKRVDECLWTGAECLLKTEASCGDISKRRICQPFRSKNGGCLNGKNCFWTGQVCLEASSC